MPQATSLDHNNQYLLLQDSPQITMPAYSSNLQKMPQAGEESERT